jgi:FKBP-type peptidyl-prolyl cis-trans isomerase (trigger factor)
MPIEIKQLPKSEVEITGELSGEEFAKFWPKAMEELARHVSIPGFRPGKVPENFLVEKIGEGAILEKAGELALQNIYPKIIAEKKLEIIGSPRATITKISKGGVLGYKFQSALIPQIELPGNYRETAAAVGKKQEEIIVEEKEVDEAIEYLRKSRAKKENKEMIPLDDEFAGSVGSFSSLEELKNTIRKNIRQEKEFKNKEKKRLEMLEAILKKSRVEIPDILVETEKHKMLHELQSNILSMGLNWEDYLKHIKKTHDELLAGWTDDALRRANYGLLLRQLGQALEIKVEEPEIEEKIKEFDIKEGDNVDRQRLKDYAYGIIRNEKVFNILEK